PPHLTDAYSWETRNFSSRGAAHGGKAPLPPVPVDMWTSATPTDRLASLGPWTTLMDSRWTAIAAHAAAHRVAHRLPGLAHMTTGTYQPPVSHITEPPIPGCRAGASRLCGGADRRSRMGAAAPGGSEGRPLAAGQG